MSPIGRGRSPGERRGLACPKAMPRRRVLLFDPAMNNVMFLLVGGLLVACGGNDSSGGADGGTDSGKDGSPPSLVGKGDAPGLAIREAGPIDLAEGVTASVDGAWAGADAPTWRINGYGGTTVRIAVNSTDGAADPYLLIDGPAPDELTKIVSFNDDRSGESFDSYLEVTLEKPGAYRLIAATWSMVKSNQPATGAFRMDVECVANCQRPMVTLQQLVQTLQAELGEEQAAGLLQGAVAGFFGGLDEATTGAINGQLQQWLAVIGSDPEPQVPKVGLDLTRTAQGLGLFEAPDVEQPAPQQTHFKVDDLLASGCNPERASFKPVNEAIPGLGTGSYADYRVPSCKVVRSQQFAEVLNNLALDNGSTVEHAGTTYTSIREVAEALIAAGHHIVITNDRFYADFMGLDFNGAAVMAPLWIDTGVAAGDGTLAMPSPHTHHTVVVTGPLVDVQVMYYMGVSGGVSFRADVNQRSPWTGKRTLRTYDSDAQPEDVVTALEIAGKLRAKWNAEALATGMPALGYGLLGVCNDSTAVIERALHGETTIFPLSHPPVEGDQADWDDVDALLAQIPSDTDSDNLSPDALARIKTTLPWENAADSPFQAFRSVVDGL